MKAITTAKDFVSLLWQDFINFIHLFDGHSKDPEIRPHSKALRKNGIITIPNYISPEFCDQLKDELEGLVAEQPTSTELPNGTRFSYRSEFDENGSDHGMLDIFFIEQSMKAIGKIDQEKMARIVESATNQEVIPLRVNAYVNDSVQGTRGFHIDNTQPVVYKAFIYLKDVPDLSYGPYTFVSGSQRFSPYVYLNILKNLFVKKNHSTDITFYNKKRSRPYTGSKGTLILSHQNAIHRGMPQEKGKKRMALVFSFMVHSKLSYLHSSAKQNIEKSRIVHRVAEAV